jgi:hypothetical protein
MSAVSGTSLALPVFVSSVATLHADHARIVVEILLHHLLARLAAQRHLRRARSA